MAEDRRFSARIEQVEKRVQIHLPFDANEAWGEKPRHHVRGTVNGLAWRGPLFEAGGQFSLAIGPAWLRDSGLAVGNIVEVVIEPEGPQVEQLAPDLSAALEENPQAKEFFNGLATFYRKGYLRWIDGARKPQVRAARIVEMVELLQAGIKQRP